MTGIKLLTISYENSWNPGTRERPEFQYYFSQPMHQDDYLVQMNWPFRTTLIVCK